MNYSLMLILGGLFSLILSFLLNLYYPNYLIILSFSISIFSIILGFILHKDSEKTNQKNLDENRVQHLQIINTIENYEKIYSEQKKTNLELSTKNSKLRQLMNKVTSELSKENIAKEQLLRRVDKPIYSIVLMKSQEQHKDNNIKYLRDTLLPQIGFKHLKGSRGIYYLPPSLTPDIINRIDLNKWIKENIYDAIPTETRYIFSFIQLVDLRFCFSKKEDKLTKKEYDLLIDAITPEELINFNEGLELLQKKKSLSIKDIIKIPRITFLLDGLQIDAITIETIKQNEQEIIKNIESKINKKIDLFDLLDVSEDIIINSLNKYKVFSINEIKIIKNNILFWKELFNKDFLV